MMGEGTTEGAAESSGGAGSRPRGVAGLMVDPVFGAIMWGKLVAASAAWTHIVVGGAVIYELTGSARLVAMVSLAQFGPQLLLTLAAGGLADRGYSLIQIISGRVMTSLASVGLGLWFLGHDDPSSTRTVATVLGATVIMGAGFAIAGPPLHSIVPGLVRSDELPTAMALNTAPLTLGAVLGPALGAYAMTQFSPAIILLAAGGINSVFVIVFLVVKLPPSDHGHSGQSSSVLAALRYIWDNRRLLALLAGISGVGFGAEASLTLAPPLAERLGQGTNFAGVVTSSFGAGASVSLVLFGLISRRVSTFALTMTGLGLMAIGLAGAASTVNTPTALTGFVVTGAGFTLALSGLSAAVQQSAPDAFRGRIMAVWMMAITGTRPLAGAIQGSIADAVSVQAAILAAGIAMLVLLVAGIRSNRDSPHAPSHRAP